MAGLELLSEQGFRIDGRKATELRRIQCRLGVFSQADGSAYIEQGNTKVLAAVYGPHEYSMATFSTGERKHRPRGDRKSKEMTMHLQQTFDAAILTSLHPRSQIDIFVEVLQSDGGNYCASVNAATLALIDAGIPMRDYVCACSASFVSDTPLVDISYLEETSGGAELIVATLPKSEQIVFLEMNARLHEDNLSPVLDLAVKGCKDIHDVLDQAVRDHVAEAAVVSGLE
ncbi:EXOS4-like protein [Mya arenaria]|uniref:EXOS4-like protein n=1 Tax=Mya arenaria TaxID=6604 RepID=A0ABY7ESC7_MYAAR|nr:EXOS4-like protein [Mya arenaria]